MQRNEYRLGLYEKAMPNHLSWSEKLHCAKTNGFDCVEISIDETDEKLARLEMSAVQRLDLLQRMCQEDLRLETMCLSGHRKFPLGSLDPATRQRSLEIMEKAIILARDLGIRIIQIAGYDVYYETPTEETRRLFGENLARSVELAAKYGVMLAFETMETDFLNTVTKAMYWVNQINSPYLMVYPDSGNLTNAALSSAHQLMDDIAAGEGHIAAFHLKETVPGVFREVPFGTGHVDFENVIRAALKQGVRRYTTEFWYTGQENWEKNVAFASQFISDYFQKI